MVKLNFNFIAFKCTRMEFELWASINGENLILIQSHISSDLVWQRNFWSSMDFWTFICRFQKCRLLVPKCIQKTLRSCPLWPTSNFCQFALLWPTKSTPRSKRCAFFPARQHQMNPYSFDLAKRNDSSNRILLTYVCELVWIRSKQCVPFHLDIFIS